MGFPVAYSQLPWLLLNLLFLLGHLRRVSSWLLRLAGADVVDAFDYPAASTTNDHHHLHQTEHYHHQETSCGTSVLEELEEHAPAVRFDALSSSAAGDDAHALAPLPEACAVCLGDFHGAARVRRPRGCRHVFHRACLDRWAAHGRHRTCPLCRAPLLLLLPAPAPMPPPLGATALAPVPLPAS